MELTADNFLSYFSERELKLVELKTMQGKGVNSVYLRGLSSYENMKWREVALKALAKRQLSAISDHESDVFTVPEHELIRMALSDSKGQQLFSDSEKFKKFINSVPQSVVEELVYHIETMNDLYKTFEPDEDLKKK